MEHGQVKKQFLEWSEKKLGVAQRLAIESHLQNCADCCRYYETMTELLDLPASGTLPALSADPFLPTKIKALAEAKKKSEQTRGSISFSTAFQGVFSALLLAAGIYSGIYLGKNIAIQESISEADIVNGFSQAFFEQGETGGWEYLLETEDRGEDEN